MKKSLSITIIILSSLSIISKLSGSYFTDSESASNSFEMKKPPVLMITEVMYDPNGNSKDEWVEVYNSTDQPINFKDWMLADHPNTTIFHSNSDLPVPPHSFVILTHDASIKNKYNIPDGTLIITSTNWNIALNNDGDKVLLKNPSGTIIDSMSYGTMLDPFNPSCTDVAKGHTLERYSLLFDTDTASDWVNNPNPSPGLAYN